MIKKDGYGLGAAVLARRLVGAGAAMLAVYDLAEAAALLRGGVTAPLLVLMPTWQLDAGHGETAGDASLLAAYARAGRLHLAIHDPRQLEPLAAAGQAVNARLPLHFYLDTGMSRAGLNTTQFGEALVQANASRFVEVAGVYSHLATADEDGAFAAAQRSRFEQALAMHRELIPASASRHLANTGGTLRDGALHFDMIRPGLGLLGFGPEQMAMPDDSSRDSAPPDLRPVPRWLSYISHVQWKLAGTSVGYGATDVLESDRLLGTVPVGYGDGYPLALSRRGVMRVRVPAPAGSGSDQWVEAPVRGRVNMDETVIDLTEASGFLNGAPAQAGNRGGRREEADRQSLLHAGVEVYSRDPAAGNALPRLATAAASHPYELLCRIAPHVRRHHVG